MSYTLLHEILATLKFSDFSKNVRDLFTVNCSRYKLRGSDFTVPRFNSITYGKHSLRYLGPKLWKWLPEELRNTPWIQKTDTESGDQATADRLLPKPLPPLQWLINEVMCIN